MVLDTAELRKITPNNPLLDLLEKPKADVSDSLIEDILDNIGDYDLSRFSERERAVILKSLNVHLAYHHFYYYFKNTVLSQPGFSVGPHHRQICDVLQSIYAGKERNVMIFAPPRTGKTLMAANAFPAWVLSLKPQYEIVIACYDQEYASQDANGTRLQMEFPFHQSLFPHQEFRYNRADSWAFFQKRGKDPNLRGVGLGSALTGSGANILIVDDYIKNPEAAFSATQRRNTYDWYSHVAATRLDPKNGSVVVIATPWHPDDLAHKLLKLEGERTKENPSGKWKVVRVRATDPNGVSFWPERFSDSFFADHLNRLGAESYSALYLGTPVNSEGAKFRREWFKPYDVRKLPELLTQSTYTYASWDTALKAEEKNDFTACTIWLKLANGSYLLDVVNAHLEFDDLVNAVHAVARIWNPLYHLIEDKASGISLIQHLQKNYEYNIIPINPGKMKKYDRITACAPTVMGGNVYVPTNIETYNDERSIELTQKAQQVVEAMALYPYTDHDDIPDSVAQYINFINGGMPFMALDNKQMLGNPIGQGMAVF